MGCTYSRQARILLDHYGRHSLNGILADGDATGANYRTICTDENREGNDKEEEDLILTQQQEEQQTISNDQASAHHINVNSSVHDLFITDKNPTKVTRPDKTRQASVTANNDGNSDVSVNDWYKREKQAILPEVEKNGLYLLYVSHAYRADKDIMMAACRQNAEAFYFASNKLKGDRELVMTACRQHRQYGDSPLCHADESLRADKGFVLAACQDFGGALQGASAELQADKVVVLAACLSTGHALKYASEDLKDDKEIVSVACQQHGAALEYASVGMRGNKDIVLVAVQRDGFALRWASEEMRSDKFIVTVACRQDYRAMTHVSCPTLQFDRQVWLACCQQFGLALAWAPAEVQADKIVVLAAASQNSDALKYTSEDLRQDPECLVSARLWDKSYQRQNPHISKIVLSTRFSLKADSASQATRFAVMLKDHDFIRNGKFAVYSPNAFAKGTCDPEWTRSSWPCRGTFETCQKEDSSKTGVPQAASCWRYSFRYQLEEAKRTNGCMIQLVEREEPKAEGQKLGDGQAIEAEMAEDVGTKVFRVFAPEDSYEVDCDLSSIDGYSTADFDRDFDDHDMDTVVSALQEWYKEGCTDMSLCEFQRAFSF